MDAWVLFQDTHTSKRFSKLDFSQGKFTWGMENQH